MTAATPWTPAVRPVSDMSLRSQSILGPARGLRGHFCCGAGSRMVGWGVTGPPTAGNAEGPLGRWMIAASEGLAPRYLIPGQTATPVARFGGER